MKRHTIYGIGGIALSLKEAGYLDNVHANISAVAAASVGLPDVAKMCHAEAVLQLFKGFGIALVHQTQKDLSATGRQLNLETSDTREFDAAAYPIFANYAVKQGYLPKANRPDSQLFSDILSAAGITWAMAYCSDEAMVHQVVAVHSLFSEEGLGYTTSESYWLQQLSLEAEVLQRKLGKMALMLNAVPRASGVIIPEYNIRDELMKFVTHMQDRGYMFYLKQG